MDDRGRPPARTAFASPWTRPNRFAVPGTAEKSSISLLRRIPDARHDRAVSERVVQRVRQRHGVAVRRRGGEVRRLIALAGPRAARHLPGRRSPRGVDREAERGEPGGREEPRERHVHAVRVSEKAVPVGVRAALGFRDQVDRLRGIARRDVSAHEAQLPEDGREKEAARRGRRHRHEPEAFVVELERDPPRRARSPRGPPPSGLLRSRGRTPRSCGRSRLAGSRPLPATRSPRVSSRDPVAREELPRRGALPADRRGVRLPDRGRGRAGLALRRARGRGREGRDTRPARARSRARRAGPRAGGRIFRAGLRGRAPFRVSPPRARRIATPSAGTLLPRRDTCFARFRPGRSRGSPARKRRPRPCAPPRSPHPRGCRPAGT